MPWKEQTVEGQRKEFVEQVLAGAKSKSALCREYGISRPTGDKWIHRYKRGEPLGDRSREPFHKPTKTAPEVVDKVLQLRDQYPCIGARKLKRMMENKGETAPAYSTINAILKANGRITQEASLASAPCRRFERASPNELWQVDFKGHFPMADGNRCHPLAALDDHSRFCLCLDAKTGETRLTVQESFERLFFEYGLPLELLCDNGNPWGTSQSAGYTQFEVWMMEYGVLPIHGRIRHPQTQGKEERFNGSVKRELLAHTSMANLSQAQRHFDQYRYFYNYERPHNALNLDCPASRYIPSHRPKPSRIEPWEYPAGCVTRIIKSSGYLTYGGQGYFLSEAFGEKTVAVRLAEESGFADVLFRQFRIARIDLNERAVVSRKARRI